MTEFSTVFDLAPVSDPRRLEALGAVDLESLEGRPDLDDLARLTAFAFKVPICVITLVGETGIHFIGKFGLEACEAALDGSLCTYVVCEGAPVELLNLGTHPDLSQHPAALQPPFVRAYCGQPIKSPEDLNVGAIAVVDTAPFYRFTDDDRNALRAAADIARRLIYGDRLDEAQSEAAE